MLGTSSGVDTSGMAALAESDDRGSKQRPDGGDLLRLADALGRFFDDLAAEFNFSKLVLLSLVV